MYYGSYSLVVCPVNSQRRFSPPNLENNHYSYSDIQDTNGMCNIGYNGSILFINGTFKSTYSNVTGLDKPQPHMLPLLQINSYTRDT